MGLARIILSRACQSNSILATRTAFLTPDGVFGRVGSTTEGISHEHFRFLATALAALALLLPSPAVGPHQRGGVSVGTAHHTYLAPATYHGGYHPGYYGGYRGFYPL